MYANLRLNKYICYIMVTVLCLVNVRFGKVITPTVLEMDFTPSLSVSVAPFIVNVFIFPKTSSQTSMVSAILRNST